MKRIILMLLTILMLASCDKTETAAVMVLSGQIEQGAESCEIKVYSLKDESLSALTDAMVKVKVDGLSHNLTHQGNGIYSSAEVAEALHDFSSCTVEVTHPDFVSCTAEVTIPKAPAVQEGSYSYPVNYNYPEFECFELTWPDAPGQNYFYELLYLETEYDEIPFSGPSGLFESHYSGPQTGHHLVVFNNDFEFYGQHRLTLRAVDEMYLEAHFYAGSDDMGLLQAGVSNVKGGKGLITGSSKRELLLQINP